jgi:hypothetical protein
MEGALITNGQWLINRAYTKKPSQNLQRTGFGALLDGGGSTQGGQGNSHPFSTPSPMPLFICILCDLSVCSESHEPLEQTNGTITQG